MPLFSKKPKKDKMKPEPVLNSGYYDILFRDSHFIKLIIKPSTLEIVDANEKACEFYGYSLVEIRKLKISDINTMPEKDIISKMNRARTSRKNESRTKHRLANGQIRDVLVRSGFLKIENEELLFIIVTDITKDLESEQKMNQLQKVVETSGEAILTVNDKGIITFINPEFSRLYGYEPDEIVGKTTPLILQSDQSEDSAVELFNRKIENMEIFQVEFVNKTKYGTLVNVEVTVNPVISDNGDYKGYIAIQKNITDRLKQEAALKRAKDKAEELSTIKSSLMANMNHEFRTPLMGILGLSDIMRKEQDDSEIIELAEGIHSSGKRLLSTLTSILLLSQLSDPEFRTGIEPLDLNSMLKTLTGDWLPRAQQKELEILHELPDFPIIVKSDEALIKQAVNNLMDNAVKFTANGTVKLELAALNENDGRWAEIKVSDTGIGISKENMELIFSEFRQVSSGYGRSFEGSGLGLSLTKKIIEKLGGKIKIQSAVGKGSAFSLLLPLPEEPEFAAGSPVPGGRNQFPEKPAEKIPQPGGPLPDLLFVEDNALNAMAAKVYLKEFFRMDHAFDGPAALEKIMAKNYSLILMDINLGEGLNGIEVMKEVRKNINYQSVPVIAVTGYAAPEDVQALLNEGFNNCLLKPFTKEEIIDIIREPLKYPPHS